jgi:histidyl-tRNA synthetase
VCLVIGDQEVQSQQVQVKDLAAHSQELCAPRRRGSHVARILASAPKVNEAAR